MDFGKHAVFIWGSYGAVFVVVAGLIAWLIWDGARQARQLADLKSRGVTRRADAATSDTTSA